jgi:hypothetical protein
MSTHSKAPKLDDTPLLADDLLFGAKAIGEYIGPHSKAGFLSGS